MRASYLAGIVGGLLIMTSLGGGACTYNTYYGTGGGAASSSSSGTGGSSSKTSSASGSTGSMMTSSSSGMGGSGGASSSSASGACSTDGDGDGAISWQCAGGTDCADQDANAHPEPMVNFQAAKIQGLKAPGIPDYDFNCDGIETTEIPIVKCGLGCDPPQLIGFQFATACGASAPKGHCAAVTCAWTPENPPQNAVQRCK